ncbi:hypothetical protein Cni_G08977 [Canna indica]|uniref:J domain-containing protein n=1 Tax=Canna indica TaxID=4628 RepID=A0AAQ3K1H5_9LILI|nr:hypothetical protein Cni_G08977 [Canna indica]
MRSDEARKILGFPPDSRPTCSEIKAAYKRKVFETHPDLFPVHEKSQAETNFKLIAEAYSSLGAGRISGSQKEGSHRQATTVRVVRTGVHAAGYGKGNRALITVPFFLLMVGTLSFAGLNAARAYERQKKTCPSYNPFLP